MADSVVGIFGNGKGVAGVWLLGGRQFGWSEADRSCWIGCSTVDALGGVALSLDGWERAWGLAAALGAVVGDEAVHGGLTAPGVGHSDNHSSQPHGPHDGKEFGPWTIAQVPIGRQSRSGVWGQVCPMCCLQCDLEDQGGQA
ncbi:MAG: hypothetical protein ACKN81_02855 [Pirellulaceae bacterium]